MSKFLYTGAFNPFTLGHWSVYENACKLYGKENVYIGIARNPNKHNDISKNILKWQINSITNNILIIPDDILVADFCKQNGINGIIRSMRNAIDLIYGMDMCNWNRKFGIETIFIPCSEGMENIFAKSDMAVLLPMHYKEVFGRILKMLYLILILLLTDGLTIRIILPL